MQDAAVPIVPYLNRRVNTYDDLERSGAAARVLDSHRQLLAGRQRIVKADDVVALPAGEFKSLGALARPERQRQPIIWLE